MTASMFLAVQDSSITDIVCLSEPANTFDFTMTTMTTMKTMTKMTTMTTMSTVTTMTAIWYYSSIFCRWWDFGGMSSFYTEIGGIYPTGDCP